MSIQCAIVHNIPGRVRLRVSHREVVRCCFDKLYSYLIARPGTTSVRINAQCGSIVVAYDPTVLTPQSLATEFSAYALDCVATRVGVGAAEAATQRTVASKPHGTRRMLASFGEALTGTPRLPRWKRGPARVGNNLAADTLEPPGAESRLLSASTPEWCQMEANEVLQLLSSDPDSGLSLEEAGNRLFSFGPNSLGRIEQRSPWHTLSNQFQSLPVALLAGSAAVSFVTGGVADAVVILGVVAVNACIGYVTERQAERTIASLQEETEVPAIVIREGRRQPIAAELIVPGDVLALTPGTTLVADVRLIATQRLMVDESALTGESMPVTKSPGTLAEPRVALRERHNMAYRGTTVTGGSGLGIAVETGLRTEVGRIQRLVGLVTAPATPVQRQLAELGTKLGLLTGAICGGLLGIGLLRRYRAVEMLKTATSLAVAAVPEGLPMVATTTLALGVNRLRRLHVAVRRLDAVETLGSVEVFCLDKTGTLTRNQMCVVRLCADDESFDLNETGAVHDSGSLPVLQCEALRRLLEVAVLCNETNLRENEGLSALDGSPTESALVRVALDAGIDALGLRRAHPVVRTTYRTDRRGYMATLHDGAHEGRLLAVKGRPSDVLELCCWQLRDGERVELTEEDRAAIRAENELMAGRGLRILGFAFREFVSSDGWLDGELTWLGLAGIADPIRPGMHELMQTFHKAGIRTIMITGDQSATAHAIGRQLELSGSPELRTMDSVELESIDPEVLKSLAENVHVFSSVTPSHKLAIVQALQRAGKVVAMTGDGINDGPALRAADIGVAMGGDGGTDVARMTADVVLEDNNLNSMVTAIRQGRAIYSNTRNAIRYLLSTNLSEIIVMLAGIASGARAPLNPLQLLWINLVSDIFPVLALAVQPAEDDVLEGAPRDANAPFIDQKDLERMLLQSAVISGGTFGSYAWGRYRYGSEAPASTMAFMSITSAQLLHMLSSRSERYSFFSPEYPPTNQFLNLALWGCFGLQLITICLPPLRRLLRNAPLAPVDLAISLLGAGVPFLVNESLKPSQAARIAKGSSPRVLCAVSEGAPP